MHYKLCVMGNPIEHSQSPWIHQQFAKEFNLSIDYTKVKPDIDHFPLAVEQFRDDQGYGFNITQPFKQQAYKLCTEVASRAAIAKSVNTVTLGADGNIYGDNTDGIGLVNDITSNLRYSLFKRTILIMGAGGAVRGILSPILSQWPAQVIIANRTIEKARKLADEFSALGHCIGCGFDQLNHFTVDVVIDGTSFGSDLPIPEGLTLSENSLCYDLKYTGGSTQLAEWAKMNNSQVIANGWGMLVEQAAESFFIWTGEKPNTQSIVERANECDLRQIVKH